MFTFFLKAIRKARMAVKKRIRPSAERHGPPLNTAAPQKPGYANSETAIIDAHSARFLRTPQLTLANLVGRAPTMAIAVDDKDSHTSQHCGYGTEGYLRSAEELSLAGSVAASLAYIDSWNHDDHVEEGDNEQYAISERFFVMSPDHAIAKGNIGNNGQVEAHNTSDDCNTDSDESGLPFTPLSPLFSFPATHLDRDTKIRHCDATIPDHLLAPPLQEPPVSSKEQPTAVEAFAGEIARWLGEYNEAHRDDGAQERLSQRHGQEDGMDATPETETKMTADNDETMEEAISQLATEALMASCPWIDEDTAWRVYMAALFEQLHMHVGKAEHLAEDSEVDGLLEGKIEATACNEASELNASKTRQQRSFKALEEYRARRMARLKRREEQDRAFRLRSGVIKEAAKAVCALDLMSFAIWEKQWDAWRAWQKEVVEKAGRISPRPPLMEMVLEDHVQSEDEKYRYEEDGHWF